MNCHDRHVPRDRTLWWLVFVTTCVAISRRVGLAFNAPYMDESDYLFIGRTLLDGGTWPTREYVFSSDLPFYLLGLGNEWGGLEGARSVSAVLGVLALCFFYRFLRTVEIAKGESLLAAALLAVSSPHVLVSKLATYDSLALVFFAATLWVSAIALTPAESSARTALWGALAGVLFALAVLSKYVVVLYAPLFGLTFLRRQPWAAGTTSLGLLIGYGAVEWAGLTRLYEVQIAGVHGANSSLVELLGITLAFIGLPLAGLLLALRQGSVGRVHVGLWLLLSLPMILYHLQALNRIAYYKHLVYPLMFLLPAAASTCARGLESSAARARWLTAAGAAAFLALSVLQAAQLQRGFPNTDAVSRHVLAALRRDHVLLSEDPYLFRYLAEHRPPESIVELSYFDPDGDGVSSDEELLEATRAGRFDVVFLNDQVKPELADRLRREVLRAPWFERSYSEPYRITRAMSSLDRGTLEVYRRNDP